MANIIISGDWWRLESDWTLYVYCLGDMPDYEFIGDAPWPSGDIQSVVIQSGVTSIGDYAFANCQVLPSIIIPDSVTSIGNGAFDSCFALHDITIPNSVTSIGEGAFEQCFGLTNVTIGNGVTSIGDWAFYVCEALTDVIIPGSVTSIGDSAFEGCESLTSVTIPGSVTSIGSYAFSGCESLVDVTVPDPGSANYSWDDVFGYIAPLSSLTISDGVTSISDNAFSGITFADNGTVTIPNSVTSIGDSAFESSGLTSVTIGSSVTSIGEGAFDVCDALTDVYYGGTEAQWNAIEIGDYNDPLENATIHYATEPEPQPTPTAGRIRIQITKRNGGTLTFSENAVKQLEYVLSTSFDGNNVQADEFSAVIRQADPEWFSNWQGAVNRKSPVILTIISRNGTPQRTEKYYFKELRRVRKYDFQLTAQSPIGRLTDDFPGGLYSGTSLSDVITAVISDSIPRNAYSVDLSLAKVRVYGWIPYQERRTTLHQLALAHGFLIRRDENNNLYFTVPDTGDPYTIPDNALFTGGSIDYSVGRTYYRADITAYEYLQRETAAETLFDNSGGAPAENLIIRFDSPMFGLSAEGLTIHDSGVNYAKVSGSGQLTGKPYTKIESVFSVEGDPDADPQHILSVSDVPMITSLNAVSVGERLLSYHNAPAVVNMAILRTTQRSGDYVSFTDPFGDPQTGYITALSGSITSIDRASASIVCDYAPSWDSDYDAVEVLTKDTPNPWVVPDYLDGKRIRVVLIGGGTGGASGQHGTDSNGSGGRGGSPGAGGKIWDSEKALDEKFIVHYGDAFTYECGTGGWGGSSDDEPPYVNASGGYGTASTFSSSSLNIEFSSDDGSSSSTGFYDAIDGILYAAPGAYNGADGGAATSGTENGDQENPDYNNVQRFTVFLPWDSSRSWTSGAPGDGWHEKHITSDDPVYEFAYGGLGGGAAAGSDGYRGGNGSYPAYVWGGRGGDGANAFSDFPSITFGSGGSGGHGGGAGAPGGTAHTTDPNDHTTENGQPGSGGRGGSGQNGADGCILIYYNSPDT